MKTEPKHNITTERATDLLKDGEPIIDFYIEGEVVIEGLDNWEKEVVFENCIIKHFSGNIQFEKPVKLINCHFQKCEFFGAYFFGGLTIDNCTFDDYLDFCAGGHNKTGNPVIITNSNFKGFVNFFDCWYENEVIISNNKFHKGTNLLGKVHNIPVTFEIEPTIKENIGALDIDNEGRESE
ncbi:MULTISPECIES: hypothetical protein [Flavobacterium]|uniref:hypothetical protein n=1 Tax=Flavobacterium TaxID=237 RepID=UPI001FCC3611|nr:MULTISPECIES: hypothetical protein [Flavobacterium]UOK42168.1 hypothetical protein LZF87_12720 [Flavobacterium enshiense]